MQRSDVFISYRRANVDFTKQLDKALKATGREVWVDWEDIPPGVEGFADEIRQGVEGADAFIAVLSPSYLESEYCILELREAVRLNKRIVPVVLEKIEIPPEGIGHINWIYFTPHAGQVNSFEESFPKIVQALEADNDHTKQHTAFYVRARDWEKNEYHPSYLLKGREIEAAETWIAAAISKSPPPASLHSSYILASRQQHRKQQQQLIIGVVSLLILAGIAAVIAVFQAFDANQQKAIAQIAQADAQTQAARAQDSQAEAEYQAYLALTAQSDSQTQAQLALTAQAEAENQAVIAEAAREDAETQAEVSRSLALSASALQPSNADIAIALALEAVNMSNPPQQSIINLYNIAYRPGIRRSFQLEDSSDANNIHNLVYFKQPALSPDESSVVIQSRLISLEDGRVLQTFQNAPFMVLAAAFSPDGTKVALAGDIPSFVGEDIENPIRLGLWDVATGELVREFDTGTGVSRVQISADGTTLASFEAGDRVRLWNLETGEILNTFPSYQQATFSDDFSLVAYIRNTRELPDGYSSTFTIDVLTTADRSNVTRISVDSSIAPRLQFNSSLDELVVIYDEFFETYSLVEDEAGFLINTFNGHTANISSIDLGVSNILSTGGDSRLIKWQRDSGLIAYTLRGHNVPVVFTHFLNNETQAITIDIVGRVNIWDLYEGDLVDRDGTFCTVSCESEQFYNSDKSVLAYSDVEARAIVVENALDGTEIARFPIPEDTFVWGGFTFIEGEPTIVYDLYNEVGVFDQILRLNYETGESSVLLENGYVYAFAYIPSQQAFIASIDSVGLVRFNLATGEQDTISEILTYNLQYIGDLDILLATTDTGVFSINLATGESTAISEVYAYSIEYLEAFQVLLVNTDSGASAINLVTGESTPISESYAYELRYLEDLQILLANTDKGIFTFNLTTGEKLSVSENYAHQLEYLEDYHMLLVNSDNGAYSYNLDTGERIEFSPYYTQPFVYVKEANVLLVNTDTGLISYNPETGTIRTVLEWVINLWYSPVDQIIVVNAYTPDGVGTILVGLSVPDLAVKFRTPASTIASVWFLSDKGIFITAENVSAWESKILSRDLVTGEIMDTIIPSIPYANALVLSPDNRYLIIAAETVYSGGDTTVSEIPLSFEYPTRYLQLWDFESHTLIRDYPSSAFNLSFSDDGRSFFADGNTFSFEDNYYTSTSTHWRLDTLDELIQWVCNNRYVADFSDFTPEQRERFQISSEASLCVGGAK